MEDSWEIYTGVTFNANNPQMTKQRGLLEGQKTSGKGATHSAQEKYSALKLP